MTGRGGGGRARSAAALACLLAAPAAAQTAPRALSLEEAIALARGTSEAVAAARGGITTASGQRLEARSARFPQLNLQAGYTRTLESQFSGGGGGFGTDSTGTGGGGGTPAPAPCTPFVPNPALPLPSRVDSLEAAVGCLSAGGAGGNPFAGLDFSRLGVGAANQYQLAVQLSQTLYSGGRIGATERIAESARRTAKLELTAQDAQAMLDVTGAYFDALLSERLVTIAEETLAQAEATLADVQLQVDVGTVAEFELLRARVARNNQRPVVIRQRASRDLAFARLRQLLDLPDDLPLALTTGLGEDDAATGPTLPPAVPQLPADTTATERVPVLQAAESVSQSEAQVRLARSAGRPNVSLNSTYAVSAFPRDLVPDADEFQDNWTVGLSVSVPLVTFGRVTGGVRQAAGALEQARARLDQAREAAALDARSATEELEAAAAAWEATAGTVEEAARAYEIAVLRQRQELSTQTEINDARLSLQQARANRAQAARDLLVARVRAALLPQLPLGGGATGTASQAQQARRPTTSTTTATPSSAAASGAGALGGLMGGSPSGGTQP